MRGPRGAFLRGIAAMMGTLGGLIVVGGAQAGNYDIGSLASQFLQSKTELTILDHEEQAAPECHERHFVRANPTAQPTLQATGTITERKWAEMWTLERCGTAVSYWVFFHEVGNGGAYYSIVDPQK